MIYRLMGPRPCYSPEGAGAGGAAGNPDSGANGAGGSGNGSPDGSAAKSWLDGLSPENRQLVTVKGWTDPDKGLSSYRELETKIGKALLPPDANADPQAWDGFYEKIGRPKAAADYKFDRPKGIPAEAPYDAEAAEGMKALFHKAGLTPRQAAMLHDEVFTGQHKVATDQATAERATIEKAHDALVKEWGEPGGTTYQRNVELANRSVRQMGGDALVAELKAVGVLAKDGAIKSPLFMQMMAKVGNDLFAEDALWSGGGDYKNPFHKDSLDMAEQGKIISKDPDRARALIRSAGEDPAIWQL